MQSDHARRVLRAEEDTLPRWSAAPNAQPNLLAPALLGLIRAMRGIITGRDVVQNVGIIYWEFGPRCLARLLWTLMVGKRTTFLEVISQQ